MFARALGTDDADNDAAFGTQRSEESAESQVPTTFYVPPSTASTGVGAAGAPLSPLSRLTQQSLREFRGGRLPHLV